MSAAGLDLLKKFETVVGSDFAKATEQEKRIVRSSLRAVQAIINAGTPVGAEAIERTTHQAKAILANLAVVKTIPAAAKFDAFLISLGEKALAALFKVG